MPAFQDLAKDGVLPIEVRGSREGDEELAAISRRAFVGHADDAPRVVSERWPDLILEELVRCVVDGCGRLGLGVGGGTAALQDEVWDHAVEGAAVVEG